MKINTLLRLVRCSYQVWHCQTCAKQRRTLSRARESSPPVCLHQYTPFERRVVAVMDPKEVFHA